MAPTARYEIRVRGHLDETLADELAAALQHGVLAGARRCSTAKGSISRPSTECSTGSSSWASSCSRSGACPTRTSWSSSDVGKPVHLDELEAQLLAAAKDLVQVGGGLDVAPHDRLGRGCFRAGVAEGRRKGGAEVPAHANLVALAHP